MSIPFVQEKLGEPWAKEDLYATGSGACIASIVSNPRSFRSSRLPNHRHPWGSDGGPLGT